MTALTEFFSPLGGPLAGPLKPAWVEAVADWPLMRGEVGSCLGCFRFHDGFGAAARVAGSIQRIAEARKWKQ